MTSTSSSMQVNTFTAVCLGDDGWLELAELATACNVAPAFIESLVDEGLLAPALPEPPWRFGSLELARLQRIRRLQRDFDASLPSVAVMLDLIDEIDRLRGLLLRVGQRP